MKRFITVLISAGLLAGVVGCGGDGSESESSVDPAIAEAIDNIANDPEFPGDREQALCFVNYMLDNTSLSVEDLGNDEVDSEDLEEVGEILEAYVTGSIACGLEIDLFSEDDESDDEDVSANDASEEEDSSAYDGDLVEKSEAERDAITVLSLGDSYTLSDSYWDNGVVIIVSNIDVHPDWTGGKWSPAFSVRVRAENPTSDDRSAPELKTHCGDPGKFRDEGSWYGGSTYEMYGDLPAGTYTEGNLDLAYPRDNDDAEDGYSECETVWVVLEDGDAKVAWVAPEIPTLN